MRSDKKRSVNPTIIAAMIALIGVLGSAFLYNVDKFFPKTPAPAQAPGPATVAGVPADQPVVKPAPPPVADPQHQDSAEVLAITPPLSDSLPTTLFAVSMRIRYKLVSADSVLLVPFLEGYAAGDKCSSSNHRTIAMNDPSQIPIKRGEGEVSILFRVDPAKQSKDALLFSAGGYAAPNAALWAGFDTQGRVIVLQEMLWDSTKYCYQFAK